MLLVTGANGLNGQAVVREFARHGKGVRALVRSREKASVLENLPGVEIVEGDMQRPDTLSRALDGVERALLISSSNPSMVETQASFINACKHAGVNHVIKFSGAESGIGFDPAAFPFTRMHEEIEDYLEGSGLAWTHLRPSQFMQVYLREAPTIAGRNALMLPLDNVELSPVDVEDIAKVAFRLLSEGGHVGESLNMTGPEALTMTDIAARLSHALGKPIHYQNISPEERRERLLEAGMPIFMADALDEQAAERRRNPKSRVDLETHKMFAVRPTTFAEFSQRMAPAFSR